MPGVTRIGDGTSGTCDVGAKCCPHGRSGTDATASPNVITNGIPTHRLSDTGPCNCPHGGSFQSVQGSPNVIVNGLPVTRIGDTTVCMGCGLSGSHTGGSGNVFANG